MKFLRKIYLLFLFFTLAFSVYSQQKIIIRGVITDSASGNPIPYANISIAKTGQGRPANGQGVYNIIIEYEKNITLLISSIGYQKKSITINTEEYTDTITRNINLSLSTSEIPEVTVSGRRENSDLIKIDPKIIASIPTVSGNLESILPSLPGVSSSSELSSQYSVRGGNYDENLVYVNDIEIYRPFLIRSGNQEGLSFINPDMVSQVLFSSGGFDAKFGDKLSSVLDITYKEPEKFAGSASGSFLGGSVHIESVTPNRRLTQISGIRYKTTKYLLNSMQTTGDYKPSFSDFQTFITYTFSDRFKLSFLGNYSDNQYNFFPENRETSFGVFNDAKSLKIYFDGSEQDKFTTSLGAFSGIYSPNKSLNLKLILSAFQTTEKETFDIMGQYWLNELDSRLGSDTFSDSILNIGVGTFLNHGRNKLSAQVSSISHKGTFEMKNNLFQWGLKFQHEYINDKILEWEMQDSAGYSLPYSEDSVLLNYYFHSSFEQKSNRLSSYFQNTYSNKLKNGEVSLTVGVRSNYWSYNKQFTISPRASFSIKPLWKKDIIFRLAAGYYHQPPFFKELKNLSGIVNPNVSAQQSIHFVAGSNLNFKAWDRPFKFVSEIYYKHLSNLIPYEIDNVRIRYFGENSAHGYATGIDMRVNGEFVKGVDSWFSLSVMKTQEDIDGDDRGYIRRPTDQRLNLGIFFQDYLPRNKTYKMHLNVLYGSSLATGKPGVPEFRSKVKIPAYKRVDLGFSKILKSEENKNPKFPGLKYVKSLWISLEVFNMLQINNTISYIWIKDISNIQYAVPNYLTSRRINLKLSARF
ncbi:carboxypeptidase-like regulatory domain-containing protein [Bacteroidota bacterium]